MVPNSNFIPKFEQLFTENIFIHDTKLLQSYTPIHILYTFLRLCIVYLLLYYYCITLLNSRTIMYSPIRLRSAWFSVWAEERTERYYLYPTGES